ncbi:hypothetical protein E4U42_000649 [Claviceps africana]|uniref:Meiotic expression up-regulated protein 6 PH domain-containing protein n=1 Tax=Claviceps africana TaxID=83212 RepID=A0A8K0NKF6_9HYPO|nr:hypothetical protein E4U42_000649 [Claviceps africana]
MAEVQNTVEVPQEEVAPVVDAVVAEDITAPVAAAEDKTTEEAQTTEAAEAKTEDQPAEEIKPVEEGHLGHKAQGASFPKNLIPTKEFFFFGTEAVEAKALSAYLRGEKNIENAHHNISWAAHTGNGLLFVGDKTAPSNVINLADTTEPETDGTNKFHFTHKGAKHSFKAASVAERDSWVAQLKLKIAEAKEISGSVTESEAYKTALEALKPAAKEEAPVEEAKPEDAPKGDEAAATEGEAAVAEDKTAEEPKRRSVSRKRASIFGFGRKDSAKDKKEEAPAAEVDAVVPAAEPAAEAAKAEETAATEGEAAATEEKAAEQEKPAETPKAPAFKRNSFFGAVFAKKEKKTSDVKPTEEVVNEAETSTDAAAPVIPPVESTDPINTEEVNAAGEATDATAEPAAKKDVKEKRKSSLPFAFGRRDKSPSPAEGEEKRQTQSPFSKLRATIKSKTGAKAEDKPAEEAVKAETAEVEAEAAATAIAEEPAAAAEAEAEAENKVEEAASATPAVTAAA